MENQRILSDYSDMEKTAYLGAIASIATADRAASEEEADFLHVMAESADLSEAQQRQIVEAAADPNNTNMREYLDVLKGSQLRFSLITDLIAFAKSDGQYTQEERERIQQVAAYLNVNHEQYDAINQFVNKAEEAQTRGEDISQQGFMEKSGLGNIFGRTGINSGGFLKSLMGMALPFLLGRMTARRSSRPMGGGGMFGGLGRMGAPSGGMLGGPMSGSGGGLLGGLGSIFGTFGRARGGYTGMGMGGILGGILGGGKRGGMF